MEWSSAQEAVRQDRQGYLEVEVEVDINENKPGQTGKTKGEAVETEETPGGKSDYCEKTELQTDQSGEAQPCPQSFNHAVKI